MTLPLKIHSWTDWLTHGSIKPNLYWRPTQTLRQRFTLIVTLVIRLISSNERGLLTRGRLRGFRTYLLFWLKFVSGRNMTDRNWTLYPVENGVWVWTWNWLWMWQSRGPSVQKFGPDVYMVTKKTQTRNIEVINTLGKKLL